MDFEEFSAATLSVHQMEALNHWEQHARCAYEMFERDGNRAIMIDELASVSPNAFLLFELRSSFKSSNLGLNWVISEMMILLGQLSTAR